MSLAPQDLFPHLAGWVANLDDVFPGRPIKDSVYLFAVLEVGHVLSLAVLGGASILLNLRLIGVGLKDEPASEIHRNMRGWMWAGVIGIIITGLLIGSANGERLYTSGAFSAKMVGLLAGLILTIGVTLPAARSDGQLSLGARLAGLVGVATFLLAIYVFLAAKLSNPGLWHVITAGALIVLFAARGRTRIAYVGGMMALVAIHQVLTHIVYKADDYAHLDPVNKAFAWGFVAVILAVGAVSAIRAGKGEQEGSFVVKAMAFAAILVWVMTAAAGRWLAFA